MKRIAIALFATAAALAANSARADTRISIGVNVGGPSYRAGPPAVVYAPSPTVVYAPQPAVIVAPSHGYWKEVRVKTWVPERWVVRHNRRGRPERFCEPGYYTYHTDRVWIDGRSDRDGRGNDYGHDNNRGYSYGYDNNRDRDSRGGWNR